MELQSLTFNLSLNSAVKRKTLNGVEYLVVPTVMITEGVHAGSEGPLFYPGKELGKTPGVWNMKPVVVYHPTQNGNGISATDPAVLQTRGVGIIMNTQYRPGKTNRVTNKHAPGKLVCEVWLQANRLHVDKRVENALKDGITLECSTGLYTDNERKPGTFNGKAYDLVARNYRPDHLAILPDQKGACSIEDGAGFLRLNMRAKDTGDLWITYNRKFSAGKRKAMPAGDFAGPHRSFPIQTQEDVDNAARLIGHADDPAAVKARIKAIAKRKGLKVPAAWAKAKPTGNAARSTKDLHKAVHAAIKQHMVKGGGNGAADSFYLVDLYPQSRAAIYQRYQGGEDKYYHVDYTMDRNGNAKLGDTHTEVTPRTTYHDAGGKPVVNTTTKEGPMMDLNLMGREELIEALTTNEGTGWEAEDVPLLQNMADEKLRKLAAPLLNDATDGDDDEDDEDEDEDDEPPPKPAKGKGKGGKKPARNAAAPAPAANAAAPAPPVTVEDYIGAAPPAIRDVLLNGLAFHDAERKRLTKAITANKANGFSEEFLAQCPLEVLQNMARLAEGGKAPATNGHTVVGGAPRANWLGAAGGGVPVTANARMLADEEEPLPLPTMNFKRK